MTITSEESAMSADTVKPERAQKMLDASTAAPSSTEAPPSPNAEVERPAKRIGIVGYTSSRDEAPIDPAWELWGMNNLHLFMEPAKFARWYNLHSIESILSEAKDDPNAMAHVSWLQTQTAVPVFVMDPLEGVTDPDGNPPPPIAERTGWPMAVSFPRLAIQSTFQDYFTNTVSWQMAHALYEALNDESYLLTTLGLFGIDMAVGTEYARQRPSVEYFCGLAQGMGVELILPESSDLLKSAAHYGSVDHTPFAAKVNVRLQELDQRKQELEAQIDSARIAHAATCGAIDSFRYVQEVWLPPAVGSDSRDKVSNPAALSPVGDALTKAEHADRHKKE